MEKGYYYLMNRPSVTYANRISPGTTLLLKLRIAKAVCSIMNSKPDSGKVSINTTFDIFKKCADHILIVSQVIDYSHISKNQNYKGIEEFSNVIRKLFLFTSPLIFCKSTVLYNNRSKRISE
ncbi:uncharacterized protein OCT59_019019 [Rhizophagus irregularis]|uniref:uncharacterized protein n=1 Tax=Rhizophagus irregularis TaxID=588596 RepID=UPI00331DB113|nr:hypothetical protein OCT59_019019 [Rhizophagus irregularis]